MLKRQESAAEAERSGRGDRGACVLRLALSARVVVSKECRGWMAGMRPAGSSGVLSAELSYVYKNGCEINRPPPAERIL